MGKEQRKNSTTFNTERELLLDDTKIDGHRSCLQEGLCSQEFGCAKGKILEKKNCGSDLECFNGFNLEKEQRKNSTTFSAERELFLDDTKINGDRSCLQEGLCRQEFWRQFAH